MSATAKFSFSINDSMGRDRGDKDLDLHLDVIGLQLEQLTAMADEIGQETKQQNEKVGKLRDNVIDVNFRQYEAIDKAQKFLGDARYQPKEESAMPKPKLF